LTLTTSFWRCSPDSGGITRRSTLPSLCGDRPRSDFRIARSISLMTGVDWSNGLIINWRGSGTDTCAICCSGVSVP